MAYIIFHHNKQCRVLWRDEKDVQLLKAIPDNTIQEYQQAGTHSRENLQHFISILLNIIYRNITGTNADTAGSPPEKSSRRISCSMN
ncbi:hypothetical protein [Chitinophaga nivalis]|uniref:Uncharacterized protein n=1 Tax=Chitinophaga nivalis TaxID=2991709 RepID=A0ABT3IND5_9BACT|nr:hypothetical protein [Chitinophaga nivalis]MCW3464850.1 hypothetical protein [Chitinophaga nivalis]MCW3485459.1 hypothetical protein [Chitinophaga nivalis]